MIDDARAGLPEKLLVMNPISLDFLHQSPTILHRVLRLEQLRRPLNVLNKVLLPLLEILGRQFPQLPQTQLRISLPVQNTHIHAQQAALVDLLSFRRIIEELVCELNCLFEVVIFRLEEVHGWSSRGKNKVENPELRVFLPWCDGIVVSVLGCL